MANGRAQPFQVYFAQDKGVVRMDSKYQNQVVVANATAGSGMDFYFAINALFWSDVKLRKVRTAQLTTGLPAGKTSFVRDGSAPPSVPAEYTLPGMWEPVSVAVDWVANKLYVVDAVGQKVDVFEVNGRWHAVVLSSNLTNPSDIALDPTRGYMFVADGNQLVRAVMDGGDARAIVTDAVYKASGVSVDTLAGRLYWCDSLLDYIETVDYDGGDRHLVLRGPQVPSPSRLDVFENRVYWSDGTKQGILSVSKYDPTTVSSVYKNRDIKDPKAVKVVHALVQRQGQSVCQNFTPYLPPSSHSSRSVHLSLKRRPIYSVVFLSLQ